MKDSNTTEVAPTKASSGRPRGRPRKNPIPPVVEVASVAEAAPVVAARKRGRPRKNPLPVEPVVEVSSRSRSFRGRKSVLEAYVHMLGRQSDAEIARLAGVTAENVRTYRHRRGIQADWREGEEAVAAVPVPVQSSPAPVQSSAAPVETVGASGADLVAFTVEIELSGTTYQHVVVASNIALAAEAAVEGAGRRYAGGTVRSVGRIAELLG